MRVGTDYFRIGAWNVRSLRHKELEVTEEMKKYRLEVLGLSETHLRGCGEREIGESVMIYSGVSEGRVKGGVAVIVSGESRQCLREWMCVNERLLKVRLRVGRVRVTFIQAYAPTEDSKEEVKDTFYYSLEELIARVPKGDQLVLMGDLNARVGRDANSWRGVIGRQGEETLNGNGRRLLDLCAVNELAILNTLYQHKEIHKCTWESKERGLKSIIDYFIVRRALRPGVTDVRVIRGAEVGSDHHLVLMKLRLKVQRPKRHTEAGKCRLKVHRLESREAKVKYQQELRRLQWQMKDMYRGEDVERAWKEFRLAVIGGAERVVGRSRNRQQKKATTWWSEEVRAVIKSKKNLYKKALNAKTTEAWEEYKKANKEAKKVVREAKERDWIRCGGAAAEELCRE